MMCLRDQACQSVNYLANVDSCDIFDFEVRNVNLDSSGGCQLAVVSTIFLS